MIRRFLALIFAINMLAVPAWAAEHVPTTTSLPAQE
jgi:hypothetical protein